MILIAGVSMVVKTVKSRLTNRAAFTLVEVLVVVAIIVLVMAMAIPSIGGLFTAGADAQAYNIISAQLSAARALAIQKQTYAGVHVQLASPSLNKMSNACFSAVVWDDPNFTLAFTLAPGFFPKRLPGGMALGQLAAPYIDANGNYGPAVATMANFCNFTILFNLSGQLEQNYTVTFDSNDPIFNPSSGTAYLWTPSSILSANGMVLFDGDKFLPNTNKQEFLRLYGQVIGVNWYTGAVLGR